MATLDEMSQVELLQLQKDLQAEYDKLKGLISRFSDKGSETGYVQR